MWQGREPGLQVAVEDDGAATYLSGHEAARLYFFIDGASADVGGPRRIGDRPSLSLEFLCQGRSPGLAELCLELHKHRRTRPRSPWYMWDIKSALLNVPDRADHFGLF